MYNSVGKTALCEVVSLPEETKKCPYCREEIIADAIKCKHCGSMLPTPRTVPYDTLDMPLVGTPTAEGRVLSDRYTIIKELGRGGMGVVYLAHDEELDMDVAVKFLPIELANDRRALDQLHSEAKLSMSLSHDNIMRLHTLDTSGQFKFLVMEYVDGPSLLDILREKERLPLDEALPIIKAICSGVEYAHSKRVLHRDLKPANIMLTSKGLVKVTDFGIARRMRESMSKLSQKTISGTPAYMAPEHIMGANLTVRSDIYSLGAVVYELLAGHPPFYQGDIPSQIRFKDPPLIPGIPEPVCAAILSALAKDADKRPASSVAFYEALAGPTLKASPAVPPTEEQPSPSTFTDAMDPEILAKPEPAIKAEQRETTDEEFLLVTHSTELPRPVSKDEQLESLPPQVSQKKSRIPLIAALALCLCAVVVVLVAVLIPSLWPSRPETIEKTGLSPKAVTEEARKKAEPERMTIQYVIARYDAIIATMKENPPSEEKLKDCYERRQVDFEITPGSRYKKPYLEVRREVLDIYLIEESKRLAKTMLETARESINTHIDASDTPLSKVIDIASAFELSAGETELFSATDYTTVLKEEFGAFPHAAQLFSGISSIENLSRVEFGQVVECEKGMLIYRISKHIPQQQTGADQRKVQGTEVGMLVMKFEKAVSSQGFKKQDWEKAEKLAQEIATAGRIDFLKSWLEPKRNWGGRRAAALALAERGYVDTVPTLAEMLLEGLEVRKRAASLLVRLTGEDFFRGAKNLNWEKAIIGYKKWHRSHSRNTYGKDNANKGLGIVRVPADYRTIQAAIDKASDGDTILVADGVYKGRGNKDIDFKGKSIMLKSDNGPEKCIIDCEGSGRGFRFHSWETPRDVLKGFTIKNAMSANQQGGGAIICEGNSSPTIANCYIVNNSSHIGGGVCCRDSSPTIINCVIANNLAKAEGGGLYCFGGSDVIVSNCTIVSNTARNGGGIYVYCGDARGPHIQNAIIWDNSAATGKQLYIRQTEGSMSSVMANACNIPDDTNDTYIAGVPGEKYVKIVALVSGNCIGLPPMFVDKHSGDYYLQQGSPCIDKGNNDYVSKEVKTDLAGNLRVVNSTVDIGAYEYSPPAKIPKKQSMKQIDSSTNSIGMKFVLIPAGQFMMGSPVSEKDRDRDENSQHKVKITKPFYLQTTEVTQTQWKAVMSNNPSHFKGDDLPVERVSWNDVREFLKKLSVKEGVHYRLPTEAEWEYACRAESTSRFYFGDDEGELDEYEWYWDNSSKKTHPVGQKKPNAWGLYDVLGNVREWCQDWHKNYYYSPSLTNDPQGPSRGEYRVSRGGSCLNNAGDCRSADRGMCMPARSSECIGFRVLRSLK